MTCPCWSAGRNNNAPTHDCALERVRAALGEAGRRLARPNGLHTYRDDGIHAPACSGCNLLALVRAALADSPAPSGPKPVICPNHERNIAHLGRCDRCYPPDELRPEVQAFAVLMERQLRANDHKPGWQDDTPDSLVTRVLEEADELREAVDWGRHIGKEAADVANMAMMVADVCGALVVSAEDQAHHEWAADPAFGCEHCARVTAALRDVYDFLKSHGYRTSIVDAALASIPQGEAEMCPCGFGEPHLSERARALREASEGTP